MAARRSRVCSAGLVVPLLVVAAGGCADVAHHQPRSSSTSSAPAGVGHLWRLTRIRDTRATVDVPGSIDATVQLTLDGQFLASDSVNTLSGTYTSTPAGFAVKSTATTLVGYAGSDPTTLTVIAAIDAIAAPGSHVSAQSTGTTLVLTVPNFQLTFGDAGPAVRYPAASATSTINSMHT